MHNDVTVPKQQLYDHQSGGWCLKIFQGEYLADEGGILGLQLPTELEELLTDTGEQPLVHPVVLHPHHTGGGREGGVKDDGV